MPCTCLDCHARLYARLFSCPCGLCQDRYRQQIKAKSVWTYFTPNSPTAVNPAISSEPGPAVESVAAAPDGGL